MLCLECGAEMRLLQVTEDTTMFVSGYEHHTWQCSGCSTKGHDYQDASFASAGTERGAAARWWKRAHNQSPHWGCAYGAGWRIRKPLHYLALGLRRAHRPASIERLPDPTVTIDANTRMPDASPP
jgi:hypothetical protein